MLRFGEYETGDKVCYFDEEKKTHFLADIDFVCWKGLSTLSVYPEDNPHLKRMRYHVTDYVSPLYLSKCMGNPNPTCGETKCPFKARTEATS